MFRVIPLLLVGIGFVTGLNKENKGELNDFFKEFEIESSPEEFISENMTDVRQVTIKPMLVGRKLEEIGWESVSMNDPPHYCASGMVGKLTEIFVIRMGRDLKSVKKSALNEVMMAGAHGCAIR